MMKILCIALLAIALCQAEPVPSREDDLAVESDFDLNERIEKLKQHAAKRLESINLQAQESISQIAKQYHEMAGDTASGRVLIEEQIKTGAEKFKDALNELSTKAEALYSRLIRQSIGTDDLPTVQDNTSETEKQS